MILTDSSVNPAPQFRVLSNKQCEELYGASLECLERVGMQVNNVEAIQLLAERGARVIGNIAHIPSALVKDAIKITPASFSVWDRNGKHEMRVAMDRVHFGPGPTCTYFIDPVTRERRAARRGDAGLTAKVCDALPNIDYIMGLCLLGDVNPALAPAYEFAEELANTTKPIVAWANTPEALKLIHRMATVTAGGEENLRSKPLYAYFTTYESPLRLADSPLANLMWAAEQGIPVICLGGPTVGLESPFTGASSLVLYLACALAALTIVQVKQPGAAMAIGGLPSMMDLRTARPAYGSPEASLHTAAAADLARYLRLPFMGTAAASDSKSIDAQAGSESAIQIMLSALSGAALIHDVGFLDCADIGSLEYLVFADEIIGMAARIMRGIQVSPETIMMDLIKKVGPGGTFINQAASASLCRAESWIPSVLDREAFSSWQKKGSQETSELVWKKLQKILNDHHPEPLPMEAAEKIAQILKDAEATSQK
jgi:trimethylamine--corrinoid protein Co-methyltransferase